MYQFQGESRNAAKQRAYRARQEEKQRAAARSVEQVEKLRAAIKIAVEAKRIPFWVDMTGLHGDEVDNLIDYLSSQQTLFTEI
jgi:hypothetical protein